MADNTELNPGVGGDTIATDDVGTYKIEKVKIVTGAAGVDGGPVTAASGARTHILSLRPLTTFNSLTNRTRLRLTSVEIFVTGNTPIFWELCVGSTFSVAPTYASVNATYSAYQYGTGGTLTAGTLAIASGYVAATATVKTSVSREISARYPITLNRAGAVRALGTLSLLVTGIGGTSATRASLNYTEIR